MELFNYYENVVFEAMALILKEAAEEESITADQLDRYFKRIMGNEYADYIDEDIAENGYYSLLRREGAEYYPVIREPDPDDEYGIALPAPVLLNRIEKEAVVKALQSDKAKNFLDDKTISRLLNEFDEFEPQWEHKDIDPKHQVKRPVDHQMIRDLQNYIHEGRSISLKSRSDGHEYRNTEVYPLFLEYTPQFDIWTLTVWHPEEDRPINIQVNNIIEAEPYGTVPEDALKKHEQFLDSRTKKAVIEIKNVRHALERLLCLLSYYKRETDYNRKTGTFTMTIYYYDFDENILFENLLSAAAFVRIVSPEDFKKKYISEIEYCCSLYSEDGAAA